MASVKFAYVPFPLMLGPLAQGTVRRGLRARSRTVAGWRYEQGARRVANAFQAVCTKVVRS